MAKRKIVAKSYLSSKTVWVNGLTLAVTLLSGPLGVSIPAEYLVPALAIANIILRGLTTAPVSVKGSLVSILD